VCSTANLGLVTALGAETVIDYTKEDFGARGDAYDLILDAVPFAHRTLSTRGRGGLTSGGRYVSVTDGSPKLQVLDLVLLKELAESGRIRPVIDRTYTLDQVVEAHRYVDSGRKKGNVVLTVAA
jgi:NADPH:quinone reductase-like Zn-dependent oxidoreductase